MRVRPAGDVHCSGKIDDDICVASRLTYGGALRMIPLQPTIEMGLGGQHIALVTIALLVSEHQVMGKVAWIAGPRHEMIDFSAVDSALTV
jgi:hypothetical protein